MDEGLDRAGREEGLAEPDEAALRRDLDPEHLREGCKAQGLDASRCFIYLTAARGSQVDSTGKRHSRTTTTAWETRIGPDAAKQLPHVEMRDPPDHEHDDADRRRDQAEVEHHDHHHRELDRVDAERSDDRQQDRNEKDQRRPGLQEGADQEKGDGDEQIRNRTGWPAKTLAERCDPFVEAGEREGVGKHLGGRQDHVDRGGDRGRHLQRVPDIGQRQGAQTTTPRNSA